MKLGLSFSLVLAVLFQCSPKFQLQQDSVGHLMVETIKSEETIGVDSITVSAKKFDTEFTVSYKSYNPDKQKIDTLTPLLNNISFVVFGGSWCSDTRRELPRLAKILDRCSFAKDRFTYFGVSKKKDVSSPMKFLRLTNLSLFRLLSFLKTT